MIKTSITSYTGPMFAGKTTALLDAAEAASDKYGPEHALLVKPDIDRRYSDNHVVSHTGRKLAALNAKSAHDVLKKIADHNIKWVGFDEAQFFVEPLFQGNLIDIIDTLTVHRQGKGYEHDIEIAAAFLDLDAEGNVFSIAGDLLCRSTKIVKLTANCPLCETQHTATRTIRPNIAPDKAPVGQVYIGAAEYDVRCLTHLNK